MSRIGKAPIEVPGSVDVTLTDSNQITVKGPLGTLARQLRPEVEVVREGSVLTFRPKTEQRQVRAYHGLTRTLVANMVTGVTQGFTKQMEIVGVGYRAAVQGTTLNLSLGFSHPVELPIPQGISVTVDANTKLTIKGYDKQLLGDFCAQIRGFRPPEPYKGKGIRYAGERIRRKQGKSGKK